MARNVLKELETLTDEMIDGEYEDTQKAGEVKYSDFAKEMLIKLLEYVRGGGWSDNDTVKFIVRNYGKGISNLADAWSAAYPKKQPKADATMRTHYQKINQYLSHILPSDLPDMFLGEDRERLEALSITIDALYISDQRMESALGEPLIHELQALPLTTKKFEAEECGYEIGVLKRLSALNERAWIETCDREKLAYIYQTITKEPLIKGKVNFRRFELIREFTAVTMAEVPIANPMQNRTELSDKGYHFLGEAKKEIESIIAGVTPSEKVSPYAVQVMSDYIVDSMKSRLRLLNPQDLARVYEDLLSGENTKTSQLVSMFTDEQMQRFEAERIHEKKAFIQEKRSST